MAHGDNPADRYNHRQASERDRERPVELPKALSGVSVDSDETVQGRPETFDAAAEQERRIRNISEIGDDRAGAGGIPADDGAGSPGGTLGTIKENREQDQ